MAKITFSNGRTVNFNGQPTQADIEEVAASFNSTSTSPAGGIPLSNASVSNAPYKTEEAGFFDHFGENLKAGWKRRMENSANYSAQKASGDIGTGANFVAQVGQVAGGITDIATSAIGAGFQEVEPMIPQSIEDIVVAGLTPIGKPLSKGIQGISEGYQDFAEKHPEAAAYLEGVVNIAGLIPVGKAAQVVGKGAAATKGALLAAEAAGAAKDASMVAKAAGLASTAIMTPPRLASGAVSGIGHTGKFVMASGTGISVSDLTTTIDDWKQLSPLTRTKMTRDDLAKGFASEVDKLGGENFEISGKYKAIRETPGVVEIPENYFKDFFSSMGLKVKTATKKAGAPQTSGILGADGMPIMSGTADEVAAAGRKRLEMSSATKASGLSRADITELEDVYNRFDNGMLTYDDFLNLRSKLSKMAKYDSTMPKSSDLMSTASKLRTKLNNDFREKIPGLKELDVEMEPKMELLNKLKKSFYKNGEISDTADNKLINLDSNEKLLKEAEKVYPGLARDIRIVQAVEKWEQAFDKPGMVAAAKVGTAATAGFFVAGVPGTLVAAALTLPQLALPMLLGIGASKSAVRQVLNLMVATTNFFGNRADDIMKGAGKVGSAMKTYNSTAQPGLSTRDVTRFLHPEDRGIMEKVIDNARIGSEIDNATSQMADNLALRFGIDPDMGNANMANKFDEILQGNRDFTGTVLPGMSNKP
jgi:hypothetical protein